MVKLMDPVCKLRDCERFIQSDLLKSNFSNEVILILLKCNVIMYTIYTIKLSTTKIKHTKDVIFHNKA